MRRHHVNLGQDFAAFTRCPPVHDDTALVRDYLLHFLADEDDFRPWTEWLRDTFVKPLMAEAKIVSGRSQTPSGGPRCSRLPPTRRSRTGSTSIWRSPTRKSSRWMTKSSCWPT